MQSFAPLSTDLLAPTPAANGLPSRSGDEAHFAAHLFTAARDRSAAVSATGPTNDAATEDSPFAGSSASAATTVTLHGSGEDALEADGDATFIEQNTVDSLQAATIAYLTVFPYRLVNEEPPTAAGPLAASAGGTDSPISRLLGDISLGLPVAASGQAVQGDTQPVQPPAAAPAFDDLAAAPVKTDSTIGSTPPPDRTSPTGSQTSPLTVHQSSQPTGTVPLAGTITVDHPAISLPVAEAAALSAAVPVADPAPVPGPSAGIGTADDSPLTSAFAQTASPAPQTAAQVAPAPLVQQGLSQIVNSDYTRIITVRQPAEAETEDMAVTMTPAEARTATSTGDSQRQDANSAYIHSRLPNEAPKALSENGSPAQEETANNQQNGQESPIQTDQVLAAKVKAGQDGGPLLFAHQLAASQPASTGSATAESGSLMRLPSGLSVPDGTVMDQVITHFSVDRRLDTSTINLKLYPQELGELRMEIKVEQDNIKAHITVQTPQAQEMLDRHLPRLREALAQQGLQLQQIEVTVTPDYNTDSHRSQDGSGQQMSRPAYTKAPQDFFRLEPQEEQDVIAAPRRNLSVLI